MRPKTLEEFVGQEHLLGPGKILRQAIESDLPGFMGWVDGIKRRPIVAHPVGAVLVVGVFRLIFNATALTAIAAALLAEGVNQYYKAIRGVYGQWLWREVLWRRALALAGGLVAFLLGCASPTEPDCPTTQIPMVNAQGDTVSTITTEWCVHVTRMP